MGGVLSVFITDDRSAVDTLHFLVGRDLGEALADAEADLRANPHHLAVEIREGDQVMAVLTRREVMPDGDAPRVQPRWGGEREDRRRVPRRLGQGGI